jgi:hypothetical protein
VRFQTAAWKIEKHMLSVNWMDQQSVVIEKHVLSVNWMDQQSVVIEKHMLSVNWMDQQPVTEALVMLICCGKNKLRHKTLLLYVTWFIMHRWQRFRITPIKLMSERLKPQ